MTAADGASPEYCIKDCRPSRNSEEACAECWEPAILEENLPAIAVFVAARTQWRVGIHGRSGLDYTALEATARLRGVEMTPECFIGIQTLEHAWMNGLEDAAARWVPKPRPKLGSPES